MDYAEAKAVVTETAPDLLIDEEQPGGQPHITVRKTEGGQPFSIMIPRPVEGVANEEGWERKAVEDAARAALTHL